jgi:16S rRNA C967 or C1407 C5-methylase (RsmB/RsmF family)/NOL1/NOP2/fmu family ribosome biogenesis protein
MILPEIFAHRMRNILDQEYDEFQQSLDREIATSIRINPAKYKEHPPLIPVEYCKTGYFVPQRPLFTIDPLFHSGVYYVQEPSSMFLEKAIEQLTLKEDVKVLDLCAAPGGKSTHLASLLSEKSLLVSNDVIRARSQILSENLKKWGTPNIIVTNNDPHDFQRLPQFFDLLVIDAPCSGEGLFRRDANAVNEWSSDNAQLCAQRQQRILADVWPALKEGGYLIYSTCTFNPSENEENIRWLNEFAEIEPVALKLDGHWGITLTDAGGFPCYRFYPHKVSGEGFFLAVVRKSGVNVQQHRRKVSLDPLSATKAEKEIAKKILTNNSLEVLKFEDTLLAFPSQQIAELLQIKSKLRIVHAGIKIGEIKQKEMIPAHELAISTILNCDIYPKIDLTLEEALTFLHRDDIPPRSATKGWNLITYKNTPLGWVKNLGNRMNSAFPKEWRIRMSVADFKDERLAAEMAKFPL